MKIIEVTCAIIIQGKKVLCAQRSEGMSLPLKWELPGGKVEMGETDEECLQREIREELGLEITILNKLESNIHALDDFKSVHLIPFLCQISEGELVLKEHKQTLWVAAQNLMTLDWAEADIPIIKRFINSRK